MKGPCLCCTHPTFENRRAESDNRRRRIKIDECKTRTAAKKNRAVGRGRQTEGDGGMLSRWGPRKAFVLSTHRVSQAALGSCFKATTLNQSFMACPNRLRGTHTHGHRKGHAHTHTHTPTHARQRRHFVSSKMCAVGDRTTFHLLFSRLKSERFRFDVDSVLVCDYVYESVCDQRRVSLMSSVYTLR